MNQNKKNKLLTFIFGSIFTLIVLLNFVLPKPVFIYSERRRVNPKPEITIQKIQNNTYSNQFEKYASDVFPFRENLKSIKTIWNTYILQQTDINNIIKKGDYLYKLDKDYNQDSVIKAAQKFNKVINKYGKNNNIYYSIVPDKNYYTDIYKYDYKQLEKDFIQNMQGEYISLFEILNLSDYYKTDIHWKQESLEKVADAINQKLGYKKKVTSELKNTNNIFYGVLTGQYGFKTSPDTIKYIENPAIKQLSVFDYQNNKETGIYNFDKLNDVDPYEFYLNGPISLLEINNKNCKNDNHLIIFRDSFTSSLAPLLSENYSKITLVDIRYISPSILDKYIDFTDSDILIIQNAFVLNHSEVLL